ncbi:MAG: hypothetical protein PHQ98_00995 [Candidatus ainarchaeum sp.]|nr:hypothetical protein [Candidatus ainarchaeum sp.]
MNMILYQVGLLLIGIGIGLTGNVVIEPFSQSEPLATISKFLWILLIIIGVALIIKSNQM